MYLSNGGRTARRDWGILGTTTLTSDFALTRFKKYQTLS